MYKLSYNRRTAFELCLQIESRTQIKTRANGTHNNESKSNIFASYTYFLFEIVWNEITNLECIQKFEKQISTLPTSVILE